MIADFVKNANTFEDANKIIQGVLPLSINLGSSEDFSLQINKRVHGTRREDVQINRLCRWLVAMVQQFAIPQIAFSSQPGSSQQVTKFHLAQVTFDVNTVPVTNPFDSAESGTILTDVRKEVDELRRKGISL